MIRISTTHLEEYRRLVMTEFGDEESLVASIIGKPFKPTAPMLAGIAFHAILEEPGKHFQGGYYVANGEYFGMLDIPKAVNIIGPGVWEVKAVKEYTLQDGSIIAVVGKADHLCGKRIQDNKLSLSGLDMKRYEPSLQWRFYLDIFGADEFRYNRFHFNEPEAHAFGLKETMSVSFYRYPDLARDCVSWVEVFVDWARKRRLIPYLERQGSSLTVEVV